MNTAKNLYDTDFHAWACQQAAFLHEGRLCELDIDHLSEEIESMGKSEKRELRSHIEVLLVHLLKWKFQPTLQSRSWILTIKEQRHRLNQHLTDNPSLKVTLKEEMIAAYGIAIYEAAKETGFDEHFFPAQCEWSIQQLLDFEFLPE